MFQIIKISKVLFRFLLHKVVRCTFLQREQRESERVKCNLSFLSLVLLDDYSTPIFLVHCNDLFYPGNACRRLTLVGLLNVDKSGGWCTKSRRPHDYISRMLRTHRRASTCVREASSIC